MLVHIKRRCDRLRMVALVKARLCAQPEQVLAQPVISSICEI
jgi:hypothetical protein